MGTIHHGDCFEVMPTIPEGSIDLVLCDLPYGSTANPWDVVLPFDRLWSAYLRVAKPSAAFVLFGTGLFTARLALSNERMYKHEIIWHKSKSGSGFTAKFRPVAKHENIIVFGRGRVTYNPQMLPGKPYARDDRGHKTNNMQYGLRGKVRRNDGTRHPGSVQFVQQKWRRQDQQHPTQKPPELMEWLIRSYSNPGDVVLDNAMGCGSTCVAAINCGREYVGIEKDETYFRAARANVDAATRAIIAPGV